MKSLKIWKEYFIYNYKESEKMLLFFNVMLHSTLIVGRVYNF